MDDLDFDFEEAPEFNKEVAAVTQVGHQKTQLAQQQQLLEGAAPAANDVAAAPFAPEQQTLQGRGVPMISIGGDNKHKNFRQTVCIHWLNDRCMKGDQCGFLHCFDKERMPVCKFFMKKGECHEEGCPFKHEYEAIKVCNMYRLGFCIHGPNCRYRHDTMKGPPPDPLEVVNSMRGTRFFPDGQRHYNNNYSNSNSKGPTLALEYGRGGY